jgi:hypothetical protein
MLMLGLLKAGGQGWKKKIKIWQTLKPNKR